MVGIVSPAPLQPRASSPPLLAALLLDLWRDRGWPSRQVKVLAEAHIQKLERKAWGLLAMKASLERLVSFCHGDEQPVCPILESFSNGGARESARDGPPCDGGPQARHEPPCILSLLAGLGKNFGRRQHISRPPASLSLTSSSRQNRSAPGSRCALATSCLVRNIEHALSGQGASGFQPASVFIRSPRPLEQRARSVASDYDRRGAADDCLEEKP